MRRTIVAAWEFLLLPSFKCLSVLIFILAIFVTIFSFQADDLLLFDVCDLPTGDYFTGGCWVKEKALNIHAMMCTSFVLLDIIIFCVIVLGGAGMLTSNFTKNDVPSFDKFVEVGTGKIIPKAGEGTLSLSTDNTTGSLSLMKEGRLSLRTKHPA